MSKTRIDNKSKVNIDNSSSSIDIISLQGKKVIEVIAKPNSPKSYYTFDEQKNAFIFHIKSQAEDGKANVEILKIIKKETKKEAKIISGATSKKKLIKIE